MSTHKHLHIGLSLAPTWLSGDGWRRENSNIEEIFFHSLRLIGF